MEYTIITTKYNENKFMTQISQVLEKYQELKARAQHPKLWAMVDKINSMPRAEEKVLIKRRKSEKIYGIVLVLLGLFLLIPSLMEPIMKGGVAISSINILLGGLFLLRGKKKNSFIKPTERLFQEYKNIPEGLKIFFGEKEIKINEEISVLYEDINNVFTTEDFFVIFWNDRVSVFQNKDLFNCNIEEFLDFIKKVGNVYE